MPGRASLDVEGPDHRRMDAADEGVCARIEGRDVVGPRLNPIEDLALEQLRAGRPTLVECDVVRDAGVLVLELDLERRAGGTGERVLLELDATRADRHEVGVAGSARLGGCPPRPARSWRPRRGWRGRPARPRPRAPPHADRGEEGGGQGAGR